MPTVKLLARIGGIFETWSKQKQSVFFHEFNFHSDYVGGGISADTRIYRTSPDRSS